MFTPSPTSPGSPPYGVARHDPDGVVIDVTDAAITRLVELLNRRPSILADLADAASGRHRHDALAALLHDPAVREAATCRLSVADAVDLAASVIAAAAPVAAVGGPADRGHTTSRKDEQR